MFTRILEMSVAFLSACSFTPIAVNADDAEPVDAALDPGVDATSPDLDAPTSACESFGYTPHGTAFYRVVTTRSTWSSAEDDCEDDVTVAALQAHLVVLDDATETASLVAVLGGDAWIGLTDRVDEGTFRHVTDQTPILDLTPDGNDDEKDCAIIRPDGASVAIDCGAQQAYVCECDGFAGDSDRYQPDD